MNLRSFKKVIRNTIMVDIEYRFNYYMLILSTILTLIMEWAVFEHVFEGRQNVGGLPASHAFAFVLFGMIIRTVQVLWGKASQMIDEVREGTFRRYLLQPISHPLYFIAQAIGAKTNTFLAAIVICLVYKFAFDSPATFLSIDGLGPTFISFTLSCLLLWMIYLCMVYASFYLEESQFLLLTLNISIGVFSGTVLPLSWLPDWLKIFLSYTPLPLLGDWPLRTALGLMPSAEFFHSLQLATLWTAILAGLMAILYRRGLKRYEAFGG
ncbi:hypothetical protein GW916_05290 [bacterium]|nr:hypothetical protein [bacterium]